MSAEIAGTIPVQLMLSDEIATPIVIGLLNPTILLPTQAEEWPQERRRVVLLHEIAHITRGDLPAHLLAQLACALYWINPLAWLAAHRMRLEREAACDDIVLSANIKPSDYAAHLLAVAGLLQRNRPQIAGIAMARTSKVGKRIAAILNDRRNRRTVTRVSLIIALLLSVPLMIALAIARGQVEKDAVKAIPANQITWKIPLPATAKSVVISPDGKHVAFVDTVNGKQVIVLDGKPGTPYDEIRAPWSTQGSSCIPDDLPGIFFSHDGQHLAYSVRVGAKWAMILDGVQGPAYESLDIPVFSSDSKKMAYIAREGRLLHVICNDKKGKGYESIGTGGGFAYDANTIRVRFTPDNHLVYVTHGAAGEHLVIDDTEYSIPGDTLRLSHNADAVSYVTDGHGKSVLKRRSIASMIGQNEPPLADGKQDPNFGHKIFRKKNSGKFTIVIDGGMQGPYDYIGNVEFSADGSHYQYSARKNGAWGDVLDGKFLQLEGSRILFSPDGKYTAYSLPKGNKYVVIRDGAQVASYPEQVFPTSFTPDNNHLLSFAITPDRKQVSILVDDQRGPVFERVLSSLEAMSSEERAKAKPPGCFFFDAPDRFHYFAVKDKAIQRVDVTIPRNTDVQNMTPRPANTLPIAGASYHGLVVSLDCEQSFHAGQPVKFIVSERNIGKETIVLSYNHFPRFYYFLVTDAKGRPVDKTRQTLQDEDENLNRNELIDTIRLEPGEESKHEYDLRQYVKALPLGTYTLQVMRQPSGIQHCNIIGGGAALSLACSFTIK